MIKLVNIIGTRPQIIKYSVIHHLLKNEYKNKFKSYSINTWQHYDKNMNENFIKEFGIKKFDYNIKFNSKKNSEIYSKINPISNILYKLKPDCVLVYGDTNSTLVGTLAASLHNFKIAHIEAGLRSFDISMDEEKNRIVADRLSNYLFCPTKNSKLNLLSEGYPNKINNKTKQKLYYVGDLMYDLFNKSQNKFNKLLFKKKFNFINSNYGVITIHRKANLDNIKELNIFMEKISMNYENLSFIFPIHPNTKRIFKKNKIKLKYKNIKFINPLPYIDMQLLIKFSNLIVTDSGGLQKEAFFHNKNCIILRNETEWSEIKTNNKIINISNFNLNNLKFKKVIKNKKKLFGNGKSGNNILNILLKVL